MGKLYKPFRKVFFEEWVKQLNLDLLRRQYSRIQPGMLLKTKPGVMRMYYLDMEWFTYRKTCEKPEYYLVLKKTELKPGIFSNNFIGDDIWYSFLCLDTELGIIREIFSFGVDSTDHFERYSLAVEVFEGR